ncbi:hypothetical protein [Photorhabdus stackebrandtii]|uniref:Uncharacterized protein n=1 Tax=Photorhabdus stackebrandtii TaxID=1123042 RepID=A0A7X5QM03_9GAMM|nr:hypothetical protein [Photorhabdus stackebrandtii]NHB96863.1 hypothetical protein [Photorhabdus stackebrandtii]
MDKHTHTIQAISDGEYTDVITQIVSKHDKKNQSIVFKFLGADCVLASDVTGDDYTRALILLINAYYNQANITLSITSAENKNFIKKVVTDNTGLRQ